MQTKELPVAIKDFRSYIKFCPCTSSQLTPDALWFYWSEVFHMAPHKGSPNVGIQ